MNVFPILKCYQKNVLLLFQHKGISAKFFRNYKKNVLTFPSFIMSVNGGRDFEAN